MSYYFYHSNLPLSYLFTIFIRFLLRIDVKLRSPESSAVTSLRLRHVTAHVARCARRTGQLSVYVEMLTTKDGAPRRACHLK